MCKIRMKLCEIRMSQMGPHGMRRGTVVRRRTLNREVRGSYPPAVAIAIYHSLNLLTYNIKTTYLIGVSGTIESLTHHYC